MLQKISVYLSTTNLSKKLTQFPKIKKRFHKVRLKQKSWSITTSSLWAVIIFLMLVNNTTCNRPPRFVIEGQSEIVLRLKESPETKVGKLRTHIEIRSLLKYIF